MKEVWHTEPQGGYLADFRVADVDNDGKEEIGGNLTRPVIVKPFSHWISATKNRHYERML